MAAGVGEERRLARLGEASVENAGARWRQAKWCGAQGTVPRSGGSGLVSATTDAKQRSGHQKIGSTSSGTSIYGRRDRPIRKKIIGHGMSVFRSRFHAGNVLLHRLGAFPLLHQPARQHGRGILLHPQVEKSANLLAEIGGVAEPRQFVALQGVSRSGKKKLPRWLSFAVVHKGLQGIDTRKLTLRHLESRITRG